MSSRQVRRLLGNTNTLPPPEDSDDDYEPLYVRSNNKQFAGLVVSSHSENDSETEADKTEANVSKPGTSVGQGAKKKNNTGSKKKKKKQSKAKPVRKDNFNVSDIDRALQEVTEELGCDEAILLIEPPEEKDIIMKVEVRYLNYNNDLNRRFGPDSEQRRYKPGRHTKGPRLLKGAPNLTPGVEITYKKMGLTMSVESRDANYTYFVLNHDEDYQEIHREYLYMFFHDEPFVENPNHMHVEAVIDRVDMLLDIEEFQRGNKLLQESMGYLQFVAHPRFVLGDPRTRLDYKYLENRIYHVTLMKYLLSLTTRACHRTALEMCKVLMSLDPTDPMGVILIIDSIAIRAEEYNWLLTFVDEWCYPREAKELYNMMYSYALAQFNLGELEMAYESLEKAVLAYPNVAVQILQITKCTSLTASEALSQPPFVNTLTHPLVSSLSMYYVKYNYMQWRFPEVISWYAGAIRKIMNSFSQLDVNVQKEKMEQGAKLRASLYSRWPIEIYRQFHIVYPMRKLLFDSDNQDAVPAHGLFNHPSPSCNPCAARITINRYQYKATYRENAMSQEELLRTMRREREANPRR